MSHLPPSNLTPSSLWVQITQMPRPYRVVDFPRFDAITGSAIGQVAMVLLTQEEAMACQIEAERHVAEKLRNKDANERQGHVDLYRNESAVQILYRACRRPEDLKQNLFPSPGEMRRHLLQEEIGVLTERYNRLRVELGPVLSELTTEEMDAWIRVLEQGGESHFLDLLSSQAKNDLIRHLVSQRQKSLMGSGSPGEPPDASWRDTDQSPSDEADASVIVDG